MDRKRIYYMVSFHRLIHYQLNGQLHHMDTFAVRG